VGNKDVKQDALDNLADALTEDILNTPDGELLREVEEDYGDPHALANKFDQILARIMHHAALFCTSGDKTRADVPSGEIGVKQLVMQRVGG
jgi:hypothetical protein